jgi:arsenate reductase
MKSKVYTHKVNPKSNFVAVMVCSDADKSCPAVDGAVGRFAIPYNDPRYFDNTPSEKQKYDETVALIGTEMLYLVHHIKNKIIVKAELEK